MKIRTPYSPLALFTCQRDDAELVVAAAIVGEDASEVATRQKVVAFANRRITSPVAASKKAGVYKGRPAKIKADAVAALKAEGLGASEIARRLRIGRASVYRVMAA